MSAETFGDLMAALGAFRKDCLRGEPSNRAIARALGVSPQTVTNWFAGRHFPDQDAEAPVKMVRMIKASAEEQGIAAPEGLLDVDRWREAHRAEEPDPHALARGLLSGHEIIVPPAFSQDNLRDLAGASDPRLRQAARMAPDGRITQFIAGAPELLTRYHTADRVTKALITAAMDARRLGMGEAIPLSFLEAAVPAYLDDESLETIEDEDDWLERALAEAVKRAKGIPGPLTRIRLKGQVASPGTRYRLADYLDEYGRRERRAKIPRAEFWDAIAVHAGSGDLWALARAARSRGLLRHAASMDKRAALHGDAAAALALIKQMRANDADMGSLPDQIIERIGLDQLEFIPDLINILHWSGASRQLNLLLARAPESFVSPDGSYWAVLLARALLEGYSLHLAPSA